VYSPNGGVRELFERGGDNRRPSSADASGKASALGRLCDFERHC